VNARESHYLKKITVVSSDLKQKKEFGEAGRKKATSSGNYRRDDGLNEQSVSADLLAPVNNCLWYAPVIPSLLFERFCRGPYPVIRRPLSFW